MRLVRRHLRAIAVSLVAALCAGSALASEPLRIVATTSMIADAARQVGGEHVTVRALMGPGVDPHAYRQTRSDIVALANADLVLWNGLYLEAQMEDFLADLARSRPVVAVAEVVAQDMLLQHDDYAGRFDPHVWMVPDLWTQVVTGIRDTLIAADPDNAAAFNDNAASYQDRLEALSVYAQEVLSSVPEPARVLVTAHDAFGYFGNAYGFEVMGIQGISTEGEAGLRRIGDLVDMIVSRDIGAVFVETSVSDRGLRALIEGAAARGHTVTVGGELFSDAMGPDGTYEGTYVGMIDHNVTTIARALGGRAPQGGSAGLLGGS